KDLVETFPIKDVKKLVDTFPLDTLKALTETFQAKGLKSLVDTFDIQGLHELVDAVKIKGLQELVVAFPLDKLKDLVQKVLLKDLKTLIDEVDTQGLKNLVAGLGTDALRKLVQDLGADVIARLFRGMDSKTFHTVSLIDSIPSVGGIDAFVALVRRDGADSMIKYGVDALQKVGKADLDTFAGIFGTTISFEKLKKKWKHAGDFGIPGTFKDKDVAAHQQFRDALNKVVANADVGYVGPYGDFPHAAHFFQGDLIVIVELSGEFISGWGNAGNKLAGIRVTAPPKVGAKNFRVR
ncbi:MAG: colicin D domain-containing protein, partial [Thermomicrobiales bacterium]